MKKSLVYILAAAIIFSTLEPFSSLPAFAGVNALGITAIRFVIGSLLLLPFSIRGLKSAGLHLDIKDWAILAGLGVLNICISMNLLQFAVRIVRESGRTPANVAIIFSSNSLFTILFSALLLKNRLNRRKLLAIALCIVGLVFCIDFQGNDGWISGLLALLAAVTFSLYTVLTKKYAARFSGIIQTGISFFAGSIILVLILAVSGTNIFTNVNVGNLPHMLYLGLIVTGIGYLAFFRGIDKWSTMAASFVFFIKPVLTPFSVWLIRGADFAPTDWKIFISVAFVVAGSILSILEPNRMRRKNKAQT